MDVCATLLARMRAGLGVKSDVNGDEEGQSSGRMGIN